MSLSYELAKELKDAGFPGIRDSLPSYKGGSVEVDFYLKSNPYSGIPSLSELIEACGNRFGSLFAVWSEDSFKFGKTPVIEGWVAHEVMKGGAGQASKTPEEAVARLYIALNKKS